MNIVFLEEFGRAFIPKSVRPKIRSYMWKAGLRDVPYNFFGALFYASVLITGIIYITQIFPRINDLSTVLFALTTFLSWIAVQLTILAIAIACIYGYLNVIIFNRTKEIEDILQDFLRYVSENLKGGMSFDKALWEAIKPRFGILADEIRLVAKKSITGEDLETALGEFTDKYDSPTVKRTFNIIIEGLKGGAPIAELIDRLEQNIRETRELKEEINANNITFILFLTFIIVIIAPALFGLSYNLLVILGNIGEKLAFAGGNTDLPIAIGEINVQPGQFASFSMYALAIIAIFSTMIISIIRKGNIKQGLILIPAYVAASVIMYLIFRAIFYALFGGFG